MTHVTVKTKSNFLNANGKMLKVIEVVGTRVTCNVWHEEMQKFVTADFTKSEIVESI